MGWNTYAVGLAQGLDNPYPHLRQYVFSRTRTAAPAGIATSAADPAAVVRALKAGAGRRGHLAVRGGQLASALAGEIDRLVVKVNPVIFGAGIPLFAGRGYAPARGADCQPTLPVRRRHQRLPPQLASKRQMAAMFTKNIAAISACCAQVKLDAPHRDHGVVAAESEGVA